MGFGRRWIRIVLAVGALAAIPACAVATESREDTGANADAADTTRSPTDGSVARDVLSSSDAAPNVDALGFDAVDTASSTDAGASSDTGTLVDVTMQRDVAVVDATMPRDVVTPADVITLDVVMCTAGIVCTPSNPCHSGTIDCSTGSPVCRDTGTSVANGTACGGGRTCSAGICACNDNPCSSACGPSVVNACGEVVSCACPGTRPRCCGDICVCSTCACP